MATWADVAKKADRQTGQTVLMEIFLWNLKTRCDKFAQNFLSYNPGKCNNNRIAWTAKKNCKVCLDRPHGCSVQFWWKGVQICTLSRPGVAGAVLQTPLSFINKPAVTLKPIMQWRCPLRSRIDYNVLTESFLWLKAPPPTVWAWRRHKYIFTKDELMNYSITKVFVEQPLASPGSAN